MSKDMQKRIVLILSTALAAWMATNLAGMFLDEPEERGSEVDMKVVKGIQPASVDISSCCYGF